MDWSRFFRTKSVKPSQDLEAPSSSSTPTKNVSPSWTLSRDIATKEPGDWSSYGNIVTYSRFVTKLKFLAYSNEVGETLRHTFPYLVGPCYALSFGYIFADTYHHMHPFVDKNGWSHPVTHAELAKRSLWHLTASLLFPTGVVGGLIHGTKKAMIHARANVRLIRWTLPAVGVGVIPFIIKPIDDFCEEQIMERASPYIDAFFQDLEKE